MPGGLTVFCALLTSDQKLVLFCLTSSILQIISIISFPFFHLSFSIPTAEFKLHLIHERIDLNSPKNISYEFPSVHVRKYVYNWQILIVQSALRLLQTTGTERDISFPKVKAVVVYMMKRKAEMPKSGAKLLLLIGVNS